MNLSKLRQKRPTLAIRTILVAEVAVFMAAATGCLWLSSDDEMQWYHVCLWTIAIALPICANLLHGDRPSDSGLRLDNLIPAGKEVLAITLLVGLLVAATGLVATGPQPIMWRKILKDLVPILGFAFLQQYAMQAFMLRRLRQSGISTPFAIAITVLCFGLMHMPNPVLTGVTMAVAIMWCTLFVRHPNLITLSVSHCLLTLMMRSFWPEAWHLGLAVGPKVFERAYEHGWW